VIYGGKSWAWIRGSVSGTTAGNYSYPGVFHPGAEPAVRQYAGMAQDENGTVWIFGGMWGGSLLSDVWAWNGVDWKLAWGTSAFNVRPVLNGSLVSPGGIYNFVLWPRPGGGFVMFGGYGYPTATATSVGAWLFFSLLSF
jgi:hypothetical protein